MVLYADIFTEVNGLDEHFNQTIQSFLVKLTHQRGDDWELHLDTCTFAYDTLQHDSSKLVVIIYMNLYQKQNVQRESTPRGNITQRRDQIQQDILVPWHKFHCCTLSSRTSYSGVNCLRDYLHWGPLTLSQGNQRILETSHFSNLEFVDVYDFIYPTLDSETINVA